MRDDEASRPVNDSVGDGANASMPAGRRTSSSPAPPGWLGQNLVRALAGQRAGAASGASCTSPATRPCSRWSTPDRGGRRRRARPGGDRPALRRRRRRVGVPRGGRHPSRPRGPRALRRERRRHAARARPGPRVGATRFVHVSSNSPFGANATSDDRFDEDSPFAPYMGYGRSKLEAEQLVQRSYERGDLATVIVRPPWFYGPFQPERQTQFLAAVRRGRFPLVGPGYATPFDGLHGEPRAGRAARRGRRRRRRHAYWIADAEPYALREILGDRAGARSRPRDSRSPAGRRSRSRGSRVWSRRSSTAVIQASGRYVQALHVLGELKDTIACDISRARKELGYEPDGRAARRHAGERALVPRAR